MENTKIGCGRARKITVAVLCFVTIILTSGSWWVWDRYFRPIRKFRVIIPRYLYQSGQPDPAGLTRCIRDYGISVILNTTGYSEKEEWEESLAKRMGVRAIHFPIDVEHINSRELKELCKIFGDPKSYPMLVHCHEGRTRSSLIVAAHRIKFENWPVHSAMEEMLAKGFPEETISKAQKNLEANLPSDDYETRW